VNNVEKRKAVTAWFSDSQNQGKTFNQAAQELRFASATMIRAVAASYGFVFEKKAKASQNLSIQPIQAEVVQSRMFDGDGDISESIEIEPFEPTEVYKDGQVWIDSRMIHTFLESKYQYADWFKQRIEDIGAVEGVDFTVQKFLNGRATQIDYLVTPDIAKELGMLERNAQGRAIRKWFIERDNKLSRIENGASQPQVIQLDPSPFILDALTDATKRAEYYLRLQGLALVVMIRPEVNPLSVQLQKFRIDAQLLGRSDVVEEYQPQHVIHLAGKLPRTLNATAIGQRMTGGVMSAQTVNSYLCQMELIDGEPGNWALAPCGREYGETFMQKALHSDKMISTIQWDERVISLLENHLQDQAS
jgi:phage anti-repressor protein